MNTYRNSIRTKNNIRKAFAELLKENKVVEKITVKDLIMTLSKKWKMKYLMLLKKL